MRNLKERNAMDDDIELFERYIDGSLNADETSGFKRRLETDPRFVSEFRSYLFALDGILRETQQGDIEFGHAMKNISDTDLERIIGCSAAKRVWNIGRLRERWAWTASIVAVLTIGVFLMFQTRQSEVNRIDNLIVEYNYIPESNRGEGLVVADDIQSLENAYRTASPRRYTGSTGSGNETCYGLS